MRVIAGRWKGRRLVAGSGLTVRPTADRVKEALFAHLGDRVDRTVVADLCCGSGGLGIEALSRGADFCHFLDRSQESLRRTRANLVRCGVDPACYQVLRTDVRAWLRRYRGGSRRGGLIVLADPPYATTLAAEIVRGIVALPRHSGLVTAAVEHAASVQPGFVLAVEKAVGAGWRVATRRYGNTALTLLRPPAVERPDGEGS